MDHQSYDEQPAWPAESEEQVSETNHSPLPWRLFESGSEGVWLKPATGNIVDDSKTIGICNGRTLAIDRENARLIVRAVNCYAELLAACEAADTAGQVVCLAVEGVKRCHCAETMLALCIAQGEFAEAWANVQAAIAKAKATP